MEKTYLNLKYVVLSVRENYLSIRINIRIYAVWCIALIMLPGQSISADNKTNVQRTVFFAQVVSSTCHVQVDADGAGNNLLTFETYRKSQSAPVPGRNFTVRISESGSSLPGCSAFLVGQMATVQFGNPGQLDAGGVVTRGAGDGVRIVVQATDPQADYRERIISGRDSVSYPVDFAAKGRLHFRARPVIPDTVRAGEYSGALAFVVTYQ